MLHAIRAKGKNTINFPILELFFAKVLDKAAPWVYNGTTMNFFGRF